MYDQSALVCLALERANEVVESHWSVPRDAHEIPSISPRDTVIDAAVEEVEVSRGRHPS